MEFRLAQPYGVPGVQQMKISDIAIDGRKLGYALDFCAPAVHRYGTFDFASQAIKSLKFANILQGGGEDVPAGNSTAGSIECSIFQSFPIGRVVTYTASDYGPNELLTKSTSASAGSKKGVLSSEEGAASIKCNGAGGAAEMATRGPAIGRVSVKYASEIALVHKKIVAPEEVPWEKEEEEEEEEEGEKEEEKSKQELLNVVLYTYNIASVLTAIPKMWTNVEIKRVTTGTGMEQRSWRS